MAEAKGLIKGLQRAVEPARASGRPSIALTGACLGENADLYVAVDAAGECGHGGDCYAQRGGGRPRGPHV